MGFGAVIYAANVSFWAHADGGNIGKDMHVELNARLAAAAVNGLVGSVPGLFSHHKDRTKIKRECCKQ